MSTYLFDLGNTRLKYAALVEGAAMPATALAHQGESLDDAALQRLPTGARAILASVASPALHARLLQALQLRFTHVREVRTTAQCAGVRIAYAVPARLGVDRFAALLAAHARGGAVVVAGVGTALTIDVLAADGQHLGGRIAPSPDTMRAALHARAAQLPASGGTYSEFASDTADALASGCDGAAIALVERTLRLAADALGEWPRLLVHGGGAGALLPYWPGAEQAHGLVLDGLAIWAAQPDGVG